MSWIDKDALDHFWDLGDLLTTDLITSPIRRMMNRDAEQAGIDLCNPRRKIASLLGSCGMGAALGAVLGPPGGILGGLLGYIVALGSDYEGDRIENFHDAELATLYIFELKAFHIAAEATQDLVTEEIWAEICDEIDCEVEGLSEMPKSLDDAVDLILEVVGESIRRVDFKAYLEFFTAYE